MKQYKLNPLTIEELHEWFHNKSINPRTKRILKVNGKLWNHFNKTYYLTTLPKDNYTSLRKKRIDPILNIKLPIIKKHPYFKFSSMWDPYSGIRLDKDPRGALSFDPDSLIYYFYLNRLNYLWNNENTNYSGHFGDAVGTGPDFYIPGRGYHNDWYLFRLPIIDGYITKKDWNQVVTMGPILTLDEIQEIYQKGQIYNNFKKRFGIERPDLMKIYDLYHIAISKNPDLHISTELAFNLDNETKNELILFENRKAVNELRTN